MKCTNPKKRKPKQTKNKIAKNAKVISDTENDVLADEPHSDKVEQKSEDKSAPALPPPTSQEGSSSLNNKNCMTVLLLCLLYSYNNNL